MAFHTGALPRIIPGPQAVVALPGMFVCTPTAVLYVRTRTQGTHEDCHVALRYKTDAEQPEIKRSQRMDTFDNAQNFLRRLP